MKKLSWKGCWLLSLCSLLLSAVGCASRIQTKMQDVLACTELQQVNDVNSSPAPEQGHSQGSGRRGQQSGKPRALWWSSARRDLINWPDRIMQDSKYTFFKSDNVTALLLAGGASIAMHNSQADDNIWQNCQRHRVFEGFVDKSLYVIGSPEMHFPATALWYALAADNQDEFNKQRAWSMMTALSINAVVTVGLKAIRNNETPNGKDWAWPSGHTSSCFTAASVLDEFYGPKIGISAYALATLVAYRMMDTGDHWASDCVFGATLGWVVGHSVAGRHKRLELAGFQVLPSIAGPENEDTAMGVSLVKRF